MFVRVLSFALEGIEAVPVTVEVDVSPGIPAFDIVGLPDAAVRESRERIRAAIRNGGWPFPAQRITVNLAPAHQRKGGPGFDLATATGILAAGGHIPVAALEGMAFAGELALDGTLRPVRGAMAMGLAARTSGCKALFVPPGNAPEAVLAGGVAFSAPDLASVVCHFTGQSPLQPVGRGGAAKSWSADGPDLEDVKGQLAARRALEVAAAGGHNLVMMGPPGAGKSLLARCLPSILPPLEHEEALEVSRIHSVAGVLAGGGLLRTRPFRAPHHCASRSAILGGGSPLRPGEITLAHRGVLFLDELPEFDRQVLEGLRQPLEEGRVLLSRAQASAVFPARPMLVAAANPCPCGYLGSGTRPCTCPPAAVGHYRSRLSGPLLDRFDMQIHLEPVPFEHLTEGGATGGAEPSAAVRGRVEAARAVQRRRLQGTGMACNAEMAVSHVRRFCRLPRAAEALMRDAMDRLGLSLRAHDRTIKVARTIADLAGSENIEAAHVAEALQYRSLERTAQLAGK
ncbi:MAG TPA: YifB family Mg chelatase-like AAA ATPase [Symbiobacteriaceae bacterium]|nr:YifB family Mg chelatase-like AAA ATPase [Symbiobacteriaceae bacterium]